MIEKVKKKQTKQATHNKNATYMLLCIPIFNADDDGIDDISTSRQQMQQNTQTHRPS